MKCFKYSIQQFENLTTFCRMIVWWWLVFVVMPGWAAESKLAPPQSNPVSTSCKQIDDNVVKKWKEEVQKHQKSSPSQITRGGRPELSSPLLFSNKDKVVKFFAGQRKIHLAWEGGQKRYQVNVYALPRSKDSGWSKPNLQLTWVSSEEMKFKVGNYRMVVTDESNNPDSRRNFTAVDLESQPFSKQFSEIQKDTSLNEVQKKWRLVALLLSYGEEWKLEAYQLIAEQPYQKETDEFYLAWLGIKDGILPTCQEGAER